MYLFKTLLLLIGVNSAVAQELFPMYDPASTMPKGVAGIRTGLHIHYKYNLPGHREFVKLMYGVSSRITVAATVTASNFHVDKFPSDLNTYYRSGHNHKSKEVNYPFLLEGAHIMARWRFLSMDHKNEHFRLALYSEAALSNAIHLDAFPALAGDQSGVGTGLIATKLHRKLACSITSGITHFFSNVKRQRTDTVKFKAGRTFTTSISLGYLIFPRQYKSYRDLNINIYLEFQSRFFDRAVITRNNTIINSDQFGYLHQGYVSYIYPGIQFIFASRIRLDLSMETMVANNNDLNKYTMLIIGVQRYFY